MSGKYGVPVTDEDYLDSVLREHDQRLREGESPTGTQTAQLLKKLQQVVDGLVAQAEVNVTGGVTAGGSGSFGGSLTVGGNANVAGDIYTPHGRTTPVVTSYVAGYIQGPDGRIGATPSARRFKRDIKAKRYTLEQIMMANVVTYRLRALVGMLGSEAPSEVGVIAEQLVFVGLSEFVAFGEDGRPFSVHYERLSVLALAGVQEMYERMISIESRLDAAGI